MISLQLMLYLCQTNATSSFSHSLRAFRTTYSVSSDIFYRNSDLFDFLAVNVSLWSESFREHVCIGVLPSLVIFGHPSKHLTLSLNKPDYMQILLGVELSHLVPLVCSPPGTLQSSSHHSHITLVAPHHWPACRRMIMVVTRDAI
jgi:hypothetical protein